MRKGDHTTMPIRVKNVAMGFYDSNGIFHPIRASDDYSRARAGEGRKKKAKKKAKTARKRKAAPKRKATTKRRTVKRAVKRTVKRGAKRGVKRSKNPIPAKFTTAKVRRLPSGDIQVLIAR